MNIDDYPILKEKISLLKDEPGSYQMKDGDGNIIYVGKAKSLVKRVKQYFTRPQSGKVLRMVLEIRDFDIIKTSSEKEALILEISLIHKYHPKYNVMLMDDGLRRDQIYFTSKDKYGKSSLVSLSDYNGVRKNDLFSKRYLAGFYASLPDLESKE